MHDPSHQSGWLHRLYVPAGTLLLLGIVNFAVRDLSFDPLTAAQNPRLSFASGSGAQPAAGFALVRPLFRQGDPNSVLTSAIPVNTPETLSSFYLGNSQTIAIMDEEPGDELAPVWLAAALNEGAPGSEPRFPLRLGSEPNLRMSEQLVKCVLAGSDARRRVDVVIFGIVLDGLRWVDPREDVMALAKNPDLRKDLQDSLRASPDLPDAGKVVQDILDGGDARSSSSPGGAEDAGGAAVGRAERDLQRRLDASLPIFGQRKNLYGVFLSEFLSARNRIFGIRTDTRRPIPDAMYRANMQIVALTLRYLALHHIHAIAYFAPIRPIQPGPYEPADIIRFRKDLADLCARSDAMYLDYSELIPEEMWTNYPDTEAPVKGQRDFAHFTGRAHRRLGERLAQDVKPWFEKWLDEKQGRTGGEGRMTREGDALR